MKVSVTLRRFACLLAACLLLTAVCAAEPADLSALTDGEVVALLEAVNGEIVRRGIEKTAVLPQGSYVAGVDLPAGRYVYTCLAEGDDWGNVTVRADGGSGEQILWQVVSAPAEGRAPAQIFITLREGDQLRSGVSFSLTIMAAVVFR